MCRARSIALPGRLVCYERSLSLRLGRIRAEGVLPRASTHPTLQHGQLYHDNEVLCRERTRSSTDLGSSVVAHLGTAVHAAMSPPETHCRDREPKFSIAIGTQNWAIAHSFSFSTISTLFHEFPFIPLPLYNLHRQYKLGKILTLTVQIYN